MIRYVNFDMQGVGNLALFIDDSESRYTGKDILTKPGIFSEVTKDKLPLQLVDMTGRIDGYSTRCMGLVLTVNLADYRDMQLMDCTEKVKQFLTIPETAAKILRQRETEEMQEFIAAALETIHYYESVTPESKVFLPAEAFQFIEPAVATKMQSKRRVYTLKSVDNQEIVQRSCTETYGVVLPTVDELHHGAASNLNALDILRVIAPCRKELRPGVFQYNGIYHTPYFRTDPKLRGLIPGHLSMLNGSSKNDLLEVQPFERHMHDNLYMLICSDIANYINEVTTGVFLHTALGQALRRLFNCRSEELCAEAYAAAMSIAVEGVELSMSREQILEAFRVGKLSTALSSALKVSKDAMLEMIPAVVPVTRIIEVDNLPFVLTWTDEEKELFTSTVIEQNIITRTAFDYVLQLCSKAYDVNWGHSGAARAVPRFVVKQGINTMNEVLAAYLGNALGKHAMADVDMSLLYISTGDAAEEDTFDAEGDEGEDELMTTFDYYITDDTMRKIAAGSLEPDFFSGGVSGAETTEAGIIEYWRKVKGNVNLNYFISSAFSQTGKIAVLLECFVKLMRWGEVKPALLVLQDAPEVRTVFDLNVGKEIPNTAIVDESSLVLVNGCQYSLEGVLRAEDIGTGSADAIVGFLLSKDYGVKKLFVSSWVDIGEMVEKGAVDVADFKSVTSVPLVGTKSFNITELASYGFHVSNGNIEEGLKYGVQPAALSEVALLVTPGILRSAEYMKSKQNNMIVTTKDRQYKVLARYVDAVRAAYQKYGELLNSEEATTAELSRIAKDIYSKVSETPTAPEANEVRAGVALQNMRFDSDNSEVVYDSTPLEGKFALVSDVEMAANIPSIEFSDESVKRVAEKLRNRIVLLVLETDDKLILCRKDAAANEIKVVDHKIACKRYSTYVPVIERLKTGASVRVTLEGDVKKFAVLHESVREYI